MEYKIKTLIRKSDKLKINVKIGIIIVKYLIVIFTLSLPNANAIYAGRVLSLVHVTSDSAINKNADFNV